MVRETAGEGGRVEGDGRSEETVEAAAEEAPHGYQHNNEEDQEGATGAA
jgi:hypothetical protein